MNQPTCEIEMEVPFHDVDVLNVAWHGHYYKYFELARTELFRIHDFDIQAMVAMGYHMVVSESSCRYRQALRYGMKLTVRATIVEFEHRIKIKYLILDQQGRKMAQGSTAHVTIEAASGELRFETPPEIVAQFVPDMNRVPKENKTDDGQ